MTAATITKTAVLARPGWTETMVRDLLGAPDATRKVYRRKHPLHLYAIERVEAAEATPAFAERVSKSAARREGARRAVETKTEATLAAARSMPIEVETHGLDAIRAAAVRHWNGRNPCERLTVATTPADMLARLSVNFVRHELTRYDQALVDQWGKVGRRGAVAVIRGRVYSAIAAAYPELASECRRQEEARADAEAEREYLREMMGA